MSVYVASDGRMALDIYAVHGGEIDAVFLDVRMPRLDGPQTLVALRRLDPAVRCCLMTAYGRESAQRGGNTPAETPVLEKPFDLEDFLEVLARLLGSCVDTELLRLPRPAKENNQAPAHAREFLIDSKIVPQGDSP